jgi:hypothetical protein
MTRLFLLLPILWLSGCAGLLTPATNRMADNLGTAILDQNDPATVREGAPAYLLMLDGLVEGDPDSVHLRLGAARLYSAYATAFVEDPERARRLAQRGLDHARHALCLDLARVCETLDGPYEPFAASLQALRREDVPVLYGLASAWAARVKSEPGDWSAVAELPKIEAAMQRVVELDEGYDHGGAHLVLGVLATRLPPALGGRPEVGRRHFERVIALTGGRYLLAKVMLAESYARLVFDRELHDRLLREVLAAPVQAPGLTLSNTLAQRRAALLQAESDDYF